MTRLSNHIDEAVRDLRTLAPCSIVSGHRAGFRAVQALLHESGDGIVVPSATGRFHAC